MSVPGRLWRVDDWFRLVRPDGTIPTRPRREVTPADRLRMLVFLALCLLVIAVLFLRYEGRVVPLGGGFVGLAIGQAFTLYRTRSVGFGLRR